MVSSVVLVQPSAFHSSLQSTNALGGDVLEHGDELLLGHALVPVLVHPLEQLVQLLPGGRRRGGGNDWVKSVSESVGKPVVCSALFHVTKIPPNTVHIPTHAPGDALEARHGEERLVELVVSQRPVPVLVHHGELWAVGVGGGGWRGS